MKYKKLGSFSTIKSGYAFRSTILDDSDGRLVVIQPKDVISGYGNSFIHMKSGMVPDHHIIDRGSVLVTNRGTFCARVFNERFKAITTSGVFVIRLYSDTEVTPEYIALYINSEIGQRQLASKQESMTVPALTVKQIQELEIPIVSKEKQELLSGAFNASQRCKDILSDLQKQNKSLMNQIIKGAIDG
ncbi:MAG: restriction endonuclease subunit S [Proteobacteria bacterium]|nr:restriction endonuclease subunit S [Candidatus Enterousia onthequi]